MVSSCIRLLGKEFSYILTQQRFAEHYCHAKKWGVPDVKKENFLQTICDMNVNSPKREMFSLLHDSGTARLHIILYG